MKLPLEEAYVYFRLGLVTGIVEKPELVAWADRHIAENEVFPEEIVELSLSARRPYSEIIWLLSSFVVHPEYSVPLRLLFARAGVALENDPAQCLRLIHAIQLLTAETFLPNETRQQIQMVTEHSNEDGGSICLQALTKFLAPYSKYRALFD